MRYLALAGARLMLTDRSPVPASACTAPRPIATARHSCLGCDRSFEVHAYMGVDVDGLNYTLSTLMAQHEQDDHRP